MRQFNPNNLTIVVNTKHIMIPVIVGSRNDIGVHFTLCVSFFIVKQVVLQGQCISENNITHTAVHHVHPFVTSKFLSSTKLSRFSRVPVAV